jgi:hypothetical protein
MPEAQVRCINKTNRTDPHERISHVGGWPGENSPIWRWSVEHAISEIESGRWTLFVMVGGNRANLVVGSRNGRKYLKTENDGDQPNNLLSLPECGG